MPELTELVEFTRVGLSLKVTPNQKSLIDSIRKNVITLVYGPAGSGKTYCSLYEGVRTILAGGKKLTKIILIRPAVEAQENLGFLPGDMYEKISPHMEPFYEILGKFPDNLRESINDMVHVKPIAFLRGKTLDNAFIVVDEAQNITKAQIKLIFTRLGKYSKMVVCGDTNQFDIKNTGFTDAINRLSGVPGLIVARLTKEDIMRHGIIRKILERYEGLDDNEGSLEMSSIFPDSNDLIDE